VDLNQSFAKVPDYSEVRILSQQEMKETQGAIRTPIVAAQWVGVWQVMP
jgi:hypothetical protein